MNYKISTNKIKNVLYILIGYIFSINLSFAAWNTGLLWDSVTSAEIRDWDIHLDDIPNMIKGAIDFFIQIAWSVAIIFIIIWAYKILFGSLEQDKTKWKDTIIMALGWFAIASLAWFIIKLIIDNLA